MNVKSMIITPKNTLPILVGIIIIPKWVKITQFIPSKYENHYHGMILESMIFILNSIDPFLLCGSDFEAVTCNSSLNMTYGIK